MTFIYETAHYPSVPHAVTQPEHLELIGRLFGMRPQPAAEARVLEIGCGVGGNLLPLAERFPRAHFLGVDLAASQIAVGKKIIDEVGLTNVELRAHDLTQIDDSFGQFDYIIAHGVYSWVPEFVRDRLLAVVKERLKPQGIALVSHNVKPGWHHKAMAREMMLYHTREITDPVAKVKEGRALLEALMQNARAVDKVYRNFLSEQLLKKQQLPDMAIFHDDFADECDALYFHEMAAKLEAKKLQYLGDSHLWLMWPIALGPQAQPFLESVSRNLIEREQYLDFLHDRTFRYTLMCHDDLELAHGLSAAQMVDLWILSSVRPQPADVDPYDPGDVIFKSDIVTVRVKEPLTKAAFLELGESWPLPIQFGELCMRAFHRVGGPYEPRWVAQLLASEILNCFVNRVLDVSIGEPGFVLDPGKRPRTTALIRWQARNGQSIVALRHMVAEMDADHRRLLGYLDGTRDRAALAGATKRTEDEIDEMLRTLARMALIVK